MRLGDLRAFSASLRLNYDACGAERLQGWRRRLPTLVTLEIAICIPISPTCASRDSYPLDDLAALLQIENEPVRGRLVRMEAPLSMSCR